MNQQQESTERRVQYVAGLRALADFFESNPDLPAPLGVPRAAIYTDRRDFASAVSALGGQRTKRSEDGLFKVERNIGGAIVAVLASQAAVCQQVETGTETVEVEEVVTPAVTRTVKVERPVLEWVCAESVLAPREQVSA